jgi:hypothetical protein
MIFIELAPFVAFREEYWTDDDFRALQSFTDPARCWRRNARRTRTSKAKVGSLTPTQVKQLAELMKEKVQHG